MHRDLELAGAERPRPSSASASSAAHVAHGADLRSRVEQRHRGARLHDPAQLLRRLVDERDLKRATALLALGLALCAAPAAEAIGGGVGGGSSSGGSSSGARSGGSSSSSSSGAGSSAARGSSSSRYQPSAARPSSDPVRQPTAAHLIPRSMARPSDLTGRARTAWIASGRRNVAADQRFLKDKRHREYLDPYSSRYYGNERSAYHYQYQAALLDGDKEDPVSAQKCRDYDRREKYCRDFVDRGGGEFDTTDLVIVIGAAVLLFVVLPLGVAHLIDRRERSRSTTRGGVWGSHR